MPNIARNVIALNSIHDLFLVNTTTERKDVVVLEGTQANTSARNSHGVNLLPLIFLGVILLTVSIHNVVDKGTDNVNKAINAADRVVCVRFIHVSDSHKSGEDLVVAVARVQIHILVLDVAASKVNRAAFSCDRARVQWNFELHIDLFLFKHTCLYSENLRATLVPLETMQSLWQLASK